MKSNQSNLRIRQGFFVIFGLAVFAVASVGMAETPEPALPNDVAVRGHEVSGWNQVWVKLGDGGLSVDADHDSSPLEQPSLYRLETGFSRAAVSAADGLPISGVALWPGTRPEGEEGGRDDRLVFDEQLKLSSSDRTAVVLDLGRCATAGDAALWLPEEKILVAGRLCTVGRVEATVDSDSVAWLAALQKLLDLQPDLVIPGRGPIGGPELLRGQIERLTVAREAAQSALASGVNGDEFASAFSEPWFEKWRTADPENSNQALQLIYGEIGGLRPPWELMEDRRLREGPSPTRDDADWSAPRKILWRNYWPERLAMLEQVAPGVEIVPFDSADEALENVTGADAIIGTATPELLAAGEELRWVQVGSAGVERYLAIPELGNGTVLLTNGQRIASPEIAEHVMALSRALARNLHNAAIATSQGEWRRSELGSSELNRRLRTKTMLVVGLGGIGTEVARLADAAGMRVTAIRSSRRSGPDFVDKVGLSEDLLQFAAEADVVANCLPMTPQTEDLFDGEFFEAMNPSAFFVNVGRGGTVDTEALIVALETGQIAAAGLDVTDPEPLPEGHPLWRAPNLIITPHYAAWSDVGRERRWLLYRENLRRFVAGEPLLSVVDPKRGY